MVATAFEEPTLFSMSARENLTLGRADATDDEIAEALEIAQAGFVHDLPWGLDTRIGEQGMSLSGGQRQRLALARAVLAQPQVLVLDDTLSALDVHTEKLVEEALKRVLADTTGVVVAHRASTVLLADQVALLQDGTITHVGDHRHLLATVPAYRELLAADAEDLRGGFGVTTTPGDRRDRPGRPRARTGAASPPTAATTSPSETTAKLADRSRRLLEDLAARPTGSDGQAAGASRCWSRTPPGSRSRCWWPWASTRASRRSSRTTTSQPLFVIVGVRARRHRRSRRSPATSSWCAPARSARTSCFEIRQRVFGHFQALSPAFHDSYTSGRVISRQTSDVDAIYEMLETGFDGLITAALTLVGTAVLLLYLDVKLGLVALLCGPFLAWLDQLVPQGVGQELPA